MRIGILAVVAAAACSAARGDVIWNESTNGDLSDNRFSPTLLNVSPGSNQLIGIMQGELSPGVIDLDYFTITVPAGHVLSELVLESYFSLDPFAFLAIQPGAIFPNDPQTVEPQDLMGWTHMRVSQVGQDLLPEMASQGYGFTIPLPAGTYTFWGQQLGDPTDYVLDFVIVPGPGAGATLALAAGLLLRRRR
jgi:hypothetical protein